MTIRAIRHASRRLVRELGFMKPTLAGTDLPPSAVHALVELGNHGILTAADLCERLNLDKSSISRMLRKLVDAGELVEQASDRDGRAKHLSLTPKGHGTVAAIDAFADAQVSAALARLPPEDQGKVLHGVAGYADALCARRIGAGLPPTPGATIEAGYRPGLVGRAVEMHARYYARIAGFGAAFEGKVAAGLADFVQRLDRPVNRIWTAVLDGRIVGTIAIDGEDLGDGIAHLRWFIMDDGCRGTGVGRRLLQEAVDFADRQGFAGIHLWTFRGLEAARRLYETQGFALATEYQGRQWGQEVTEQHFVRPRPCMEAPRASGLHL